MKQELLNQLKDRFPWAVNDNGEINISNGYLSNCSNGRFHIIWSFLEEIENYFTERGHKLDVRIEKIFENYGGLEFIISNANEELNEIKTKYENQSLENCERCNKPGKEYKTRNRYKILCKPCAKKWWQYQIRCFDWGGKK
jgi:formylmethanofuran dehydrogenase subunit E